MRKICWVGILYSALTFVFISIFSLEGLSQVTISGRGILPTPPLRVTISTAERSTSSIYTFENPSPVDVEIVPMVDCPSGVSVALLSLPLPIESGASQNVEVRFVGLPGEVEEGEVIECVIIGGTTQEPLFLQMVSPRQSPALGNLNLNFDLIPDNTQLEAVPFFVDFTSNLEVSVTLSGLTANADIGFGTTGIEFAVLTFDAILGVFDITAQTVFAAAFGSQNELLANGEISFVKKRFRVQFDLFGLTVDNLAIFENTKFVHPFPDNAAALEAIQSPTYRFGNILRLNGRTNLNIPLRMTIGTCADPSQANRIKNRIFPGSTCSSDLLTFDVIQLVGGPLDIGGVQLLSTFEFRPNLTFRGVFSLRNSLFDLINVTSTAILDDKGQVMPQVIIGSLSQPQQSFTLQLDSTLKPVSLLARFTASIDTHSVSVLVRATDDGFNSTSLTFINPINQGRLLTSLRFSATGTNMDTIEFTQATFNWNQNIGPIRFNANLSFGINGLQRARISLDTLF